MGSPTPSRRPPLTWWVTGTGVGAAVIAWMVALALTIPSPAGDGQAWPLAMGPAGAVLLIGPAAVAAAVAPMVTRWSARRTSPALVAAGLMSVAAGLAGNAAGTLAAQTRFWPGMAVDPWSSGRIGLVVGNPADAALLVGVLLMTVAGALGLCRECGALMRGGAVVAAVILVAALALWVYAPLRSIELTAWAVV